MVQRVVQNKKSTDHVSYIRFLEQKIRFHESVQVQTVIFVRHLSLKNICNYLLIFTRKMKNLLIRFLSLKLQRN